MWPRFDFCQYFLDRVLFIVSIVPCYQPRERELALFFSILLIFIWGCLSRFSKVNVELELQGATSNLIQVEAYTKILILDGRLAGVPYGNEFLHLRGWQTDTRGSDGKDSI